MADRSVTVRLRADISQFQRSMSTAGSSVSMFEKRLDSTDGSINQLTGRLRVLGEVAAVLGPALAPIGAVGIPAVTGLSAQLGFAAVAGGVLVGSLRGLGTALDAMNKADLEPTAENLAKAEDALNALAPAARQFAKDLRGIAPELKAVRDIGAEALVPGLTESLDDLERIAPKVAAIFDSVGGALGDIAADGAASLASERWADFFDFIAREAPQALSELAATVGSLTHGMAEMWQAFDPLNDDFSTWLMGAAADFDDFASGLSQTQGFAEFVDYIRTNGPQVADTMGAIGNAVLQIVEASAPLGGPVLSALESVSDVVAAIADSDLGTPIVAGVAALSLLNRTLAVTASLSKVSLSSGLFAGLGTVTAGAGRGSASLRGLTADLGILARNYGTAGAASQRMAAQNKLATDNLKKMGGAVAGPAALLGGLAVASSGVADSFGLSNTASLALIGSMGGPLGAAAGGATGVLLDLAGASHDVSDGIAAIDTAIEANDLDALAASTERTNQAFAKQQGITAGLNSSLPGLGGLYDMLGGKSDEAAAANERSETATKKLHAVETAREEDAKMAALTYARSVGVNMDLGQSALATVKEIEAQAAAMVKSREAAQQLAETFGGLGPSLNDAKVSFGDWLSEIEASKRALDNFNDNSLKAAKRGLDEGLIMSLRNAGKEGALRMEQLADGSEDGVRRANRAYRELQRETERTREITEKLSGIVVDIKTDKAQAAIASLEARLRGIADEDVFINVRHNPIGSPATGFGPQDYSSGGFTGVGGKHEPAGVVHRGEVVIPQELVERDWGHLRSRYGHLPGFDGGGFVGKAGGNGAQGSAEERLAVLRAEQSIRELVRSLKADGKNKLGPNAREIAKVELEAAKASLKAAEANLGSALRGKEAEAAQELLSAAKLQSDAARSQMDAAQSMLDSILAQRDSVASTVAGNFNNDIFGNGLAGAMLQLNADTNDAGTFEGLIRSLAGSGLDGAAFSALSGSGDLTTAQQLLAGGPGSIDAFEAAYAARAAAQTSVGGFAADQQFGAQIEAQILEVQKQTAASQDVAAAVMRMENRIAQLEGAVERGSERGTRAGNKDKDTDTKQRTRNGR